MKPIKIALGICAAACLMPQAWACYVVYNPANQIVYSGAYPPVDLSYQIHQVLPAAFPTGHLVFDNSSPCESLDARKVAPLLTNVPGAAAAPPSRARPAATGQTPRPS